MATVTHDGQSFMIDSRRVWLVAGQIDYGRIPHEAWADRIHAAKLAGFNTIATSVPWALHEPRAGQFDFAAGRDLRRFIQLIHHAGLFCILRPGPYFGGGWDMGGIPGWVTSKPDIKLRAGSAPFLEAASRYITAIAEQVKDLQVTSPGEGGPIIMLQSESEWTCGDDLAAKTYLGELARYYREAGFAVPSINSNNLWQSVEGEIDGWVGNADMLATLRQLAAVSPDQPRIVVDMPLCNPSFVGGPSEPELTPYALQRRLVEVLAGGGQFVANPIAGGLTPGFWPGRDGQDASRYIENHHGKHAPITDAGTAGDSYHIIRRVTTMASSFARVFANLDHNYKPILLDQRFAQSSAGDSIAVIDLVGSQGSVAFLLAKEPAVPAKSTRVRTMDLLLGDGSSLTVSLGKQAAAWVLFDVLLDSRGMLDYCTLNAMSLVGKCLVCFGPAGTEGVVSINGSPLIVDVPKGKVPVIEEHEGFTVIVANEDSIDTVFASEQGVFIGVDSVSADGEPVGLPGSKSCTLYSPEGKKQKIVIKKARPARSSSSSVALADWKAVPADEYIDGTNPRYAPIDGPGDLADLGSPFGYGWYKIHLKSGDGKKHKVLSPRSRDRLHFFIDGDDAGIWGFGPGATHEPMDMSLSKSEHTMVVLAENLGRPDSGMVLNEPKGFVDELYEIKPFKVGRHSIDHSVPIQPLSSISPLWHMRPSDTTFPDRLTWSFVHRKKSPIIISFEPLPCRVLVILNDEPVRFLDQAGPSRLVLDQEELNRGNNTLQFAVLGDEPDPSASLADLAAATSFVEGVDSITAKATWSFAKWEPPAPSDFTVVPKNKLGSFKTPTWFKSSFQIDPEDAPVHLDLTGLTKGQVFLNDQHLGRYFVETATHKAVGPSTTMLLPNANIRAGRKNELLIFDEHGGSPAKLKIMVDNASVSIKR
jgi:hypothetical protein